MSHITPDDLDQIFVYVLPGVPRHDKDRFINLVRWLTGKIEREVKSFEGEVLLGPDPVKDDPMSKAEIEEGIRRFEERQQLRGTDWK